MSLKNYPIYSFIQIYLKAVILKSEQFIITHS